MSQQLHTIKRKNCTSFTEEKKEGGSVLGGYVRGLCPDTRLSILTMSAFAGVWPQF